MLLGYLSPGRDRRVETVFLLESIITLLQGIIAAMMSAVLSSLVCVLCVTLLPAVSAEHCTGFWDTSGNYYDIQQCGNYYCCGNCNKKYCCADAKFHLSQDKQGLCPQRDSYVKGNHAGLLLASIIGTLLPLIFCVGLIICCVSPCCFLYKKCCRRQRRQTVIHTTIVNAPQQPTAPPGHPQGVQYPGYQPVPFQPGYAAQPMPSAPPPSAAYSPGPYSQVAFSQGQPVYSPQPPEQLNAPPPYSDDLAHPPYNPSYSDGPHT